MSLELWTGKVLVCCKQSLMGHCDGSLEDQNIKRNADGEAKIVTFQRRTWTPVGTGLGPFLLYPGKESGHILPGSRAFQGG